MSVFDEESLRSALLMVGGLARRGSASSTSALSPPPAQSRALDDEDLAPSDPPIGSTLTQPLSIPSSGTREVVSLSVSPGSELTSGEATGASMSPRSFVAEEGVLRRARGASVSHVELGRDLSAGRTATCEGRGKGKGKAKARGA